MGRTAIVVGAGLAGLQTAWFLSQEGWSVTVLERREGVALETSFANGGLITPSHAAPWNSPGILRTLLSSLNDETAALYLKTSAIPQYFSWGLKFLRNSNKSRFFRTIERNGRLARYSQDQLNKIVGSLGIPFDGANRGTIMYYRNTASYERAKTVNSAMSDAGVPVQFCSTHDIVGLEPALHSIQDKISGGFYYPADQHGDAHLFCRALAKQLEEHGVQFRFNEPVTDFNLSGSRITQVVTSKQRYDADQIILAAGLWSTEIGKKLRLRLPIQPVKGYSVTYDLQGFSGTPSIPVVDDELHVGLTPLGQRMRFVGTAEFSGFSPDINPVRVNNLRKTALAIYPDMEPYLTQNRQISAWCGHRPMTPDCLPVVGQFGPENLYLNTGHGYLGWTTTSGTSRAISDLIVGRQPKINSADYGLARF